MTKKYWTRAMISSLLLTSPFAFSCPQDKGACSAKHSSSMYFMDYADDLKLTDTQVAKLNKIRLSSEKEWQQFHLKSELAQQDLMKVSHDPAADRKKIEKAIEAVSQADKDMLKSEAFGILDARDVLTAEQLKKIRETYGHGMKFSCHGDTKKE